VQAFVRGCSVATTSAITQRLPTRSTLAGGRPCGGVARTPAKSSDCRDPDALGFATKLARKLEEHADEVVAAYLATIGSDDPNRTYRAADAWI
jgi:hypothetical protein